MRNFELASFWPATALSLLYHPSRSGQSISAGRSWPRAQLPPRAAAYGFSAEAAAGGARARGLAERPERAPWDSAGCAGGFGASGAGSARGRQNAALGGCGLFSPRMWVKWRYAGGFSMPRTSAGFTRSWVFVYGGLNFFARLKTVFGGFRWINADGETWWIVWTERIVGKFAGENNTGVGWKLPSAAITITARRNGIFFLLGRFNAAERRDVSHQADGLSRQALSRISR